MVATMIVIVIGIGQGEREGERDGRTNGWIVLGYPDVRDVGDGES